MEKLSKVSLKDTTTKVLVKGRWIFKILVGGTVLAVKLANPVIAHSYEGVSGPGSAGPSGGVSGPGSAATSDGNGGEPRWGEPEPPYRWQWNRETRRFDRVPRVQLAQEQAPQIQQAESADSITILAQESRRTVTQPAPRSATPPPQARPANVAPRPATPPPPVRTATVQNCQATDRALQLATTRAEAAEQALADKKRALAEQESAPGSVVRFKSWARRNAGTIIGGKLILLVALTSFLVGRKTKKCPPPPITRDF